MEPPLSVMELGMTAVFLTATATTTVLLPGVFRFTCKFQGLAAPTLVPAALAEETRAMAAAAGAAGSSSSSRTSPSQPTNSRAALRGSLTPDRTIAVASGAGLPAKRITLFPVADGYRRCPRYRARAVPDPGEPEQFGNTSIYGGKALSG